METKPIEGIILSPERHKELLDAEQVYAKKYEALNKKLDEYTETDFDFIDFGYNQHDPLYYGGLVKKKSINGALVAEIKRLRGDWQAMHSDLIAEQLKNNELKLKYLKLKASKGGFWSWF